MNEVFLPLVNMVFQLVFLPLVFQLLINAVLMLLVNVALLLLVNDVLLLLVTLVYW